MLKGLCSAGAQLSGCLGELAGQSTACRARAAQCRAIFEQLSSATHAATAVVRNQAIASLQEAHTGPDIDTDQAETNQVKLSILRLLMKYPNLNWYDQLDNDITYVPH